MLEVSDGEIAQRVKDILDVARSDWTGMPLPYNTENPPPQVKARSLLTCFFNNLDVLLTMAYQDGIPLGTITGGMDIGSDNDDGLEQPAAGVTSKGGSTRIPTAHVVTPTPKPGLGSQ